MGGLAPGPRGIGCVYRNIDILDRWPGGRREVCAIARLVGVLVHHEDDKVMYALLAIVRDSVALSDGY